MEDFDGIWQILVALGFFLFTGRRIVRKLLTTVGDEPNAIPAPPRKRPAKKRPVVSPAPAVERKETQGDWDEEKEILQNIQLRMMEVPAKSKKKTTAPPVQKTAPVLKEKKHSRRGLAQLKTPEQFKQAFIYSEIFGRKYT